MRIPGKGFRSILLFFLTFPALLASAQDITGIWKGYFITESGEYYKLEFQVAQTGGYGVTGVSYSYLDVRFYGKASMTGTFVKTTNIFRIREIKTVEVKSSIGGATCIMNYNFLYSRSGKEEFLDGTYLGKYESKLSSLTGKWGDCGEGKVHLRKVTTTDFYIEPFLKNKINERPLIINEPPRKDDSIVEKPVVKKDSAKTKPVVKKTEPSKPVNKTVSKPVSKPTQTITKKPETKTTLVTKPNTKPLVTVQPKDSVKTKVIPPVTKPVTVKTEPTPAVIRDRTNELVKVLTVRDAKVTVKIYDNGEIDGDSISVYLDKKLVISHQMLTASPITVTFNMEEDNEEHELTMVAENLGTIPPNTSLMIVESGEQRFEVRITSTEQKNAVVRFKYQKPD